MTPPDKDSVERLAALLVIVSAEADSDDDAYVFGFTPDDARETSTILRALQARVDALESERDAAQAALDRALDAELERAATDLEKLARVTRASGLHDRAVGIRDARDHCRALKRQPRKGE